MNKRRRNLIAGALFSYAFGAFGIFFFLDVRWNGTAPTTPNPLRGQIFSHNEHGSITYFSAFQTTSCALLFWSTFLAFWLCMIIGPKANVRVRKLGRVPIAWGWKPDDPEQLQRKGVAVGGLATLLIVLGIGPYLVGWLNSIGVVFPFG